jgi:hypothetical protein
MNLHNNSRRSFLANAAILTAGIAIASPVQLLANTATTENLKQRWTSFCQLQQGIRWQKNIQLKDDAVARIAKGQLYNTGEIVHFEEADVIARPLWIYWSEKKAIPDDVIITFFSNKETPEKLFRLNRFELEGLLKLAKQQDRTDFVAFLKEDHQNRLVTNNNRQSKLVVKTKVSTKQTIRIDSSFAKQVSTIEKKLNYNA